MSSTHKQTFICLNEYFHKFMLSKYGVYPCCTRRVLRRLYAIQATCFSLYILLTIWTYIHPYVVTIFDKMCTLLISSSEYLYLIIIISALCMGVLRGKAFKSAAMNLVPLCASKMVLLSIIFASIELDTSELVSYG